MLILQHEETEVQDDQVMCPESHNSKLKSRVQMQICLTSKPSHRVPQAALITSGFFWNNWGKGPGWRGMSLY